MEFIATSAKETQKIAAKLIRDLVREKAERVLVLGLVGELGAGKTTFVQGLAKALKIKERVLSPTFVIFKRFKIYELRFKNLYHIDCYRIEKQEEVRELGFEEILKNPENLVVIEWAEKIKDALPKDAIWIKFEHAGEDRRKIKIQKSKISPRTF
ncbi:MAG: UPF0079 ATP-binding protein [Parcubacteria group bacterium LiPW_39]|nr:MAG: UPF0079 ATP-binding protein [Parcubacteria group bacterium LiPW_39]